MMSVPGRDNFLGEVPLGIWKYGRDSRARKITQNLYVCIYKFMHHTDCNYLCVFSARQWASFPLMANVGRPCTCMLSCARLFVTLWTVAARLLCPRNFSGKNTGGGCRFLLQGIFPAQESNPCLLYLLHCRQILYLLRHSGFLDTFSLASVTFVSQMPHETDFLIS